MRGTGGGAAPKPDSQKINHHPPSHDTVRLPSDGRQAPIPEPSRLLRHDARDLWDAMWRLPEAAMWTAADIPALTRLTTLQTDPEAWKVASTLAEMRQLEDRFGMNPYARRQLRWVIAEPEQESTSTKPSKYAHLRSAG